MGKKFGWMLGLVLAVAALAGCAGTPGAGAYGSPSPSNVSPATNLAQTVGKDQAAVPSNSYGGQGFVNNHFASESDATVRMKLLEIAMDAHWTPEQIEAALKASSSAPQTVNITGATSASGGNAASIGSGTGGGAGVGGAGSATKP